MTARRQTKTKIALQKVLSTMKLPLSAQQLFDKAKNIVPSIDRATVYRFLKAGVDSGTVIEIAVPGEERRYELAASGACTDTSCSHSECGLIPLSMIGVKAPPKLTTLTHAHPHFLCEKCNQLFCLEDTKLHLEDALPKKFRLSKKPIVLTGTCAECS